MYPLKVSTWPSAKATKANQRTDLEIIGFEDFSRLCEDVKPYKYKIDQPIMTRRWQESRARTNQESIERYVITLDYDSTLEEPSVIHTKLNQLGISNFIFTTWTHKTIETPQKKNNGKNCFKVFIDLIAESPEELFILTTSLGDKVGKTDIKMVDDISSGIFFGGAHPDFIKESEFYFDDAGMERSELRLWLLETAPARVEIKQDPIDAFETWDKTQGQKFAPERIKKALEVIKYEGVENFSKMAIWYSLGYALHSAKDASAAEGVDLFDMWDNWCLDNCAEHGVYNREENEKFWEKQTAPDRHKNLCTLSTLWHLEKIFKAKEAASAIRQSSWTFFDIMAKEEPEEVKFLIKDLLVENSIGFLVGTGGVGKSSLCLEVAKAVSSGENFFDDEKYPTLQGTVAIINKEDSHIKVHNQIHNLLELDYQREVHKAKGVTTDFDDEEFEPTLPGNIREILIKRWENVARPSWAQSNIRLTNADGEDLEALGAVMGSLKSLKEELIEEGKPELSLVIVDPLNLWHGGDQNSQRDMSFIFSALQQIQKDIGVTVLIVHHMNKSKGFSGSHTIRDSGRFMWYLRPKENGAPDGTELIEFYVEKNNDAKANYVALDFFRTDKGLLERAHNISTEGAVDAD